MKYKTMRLMSFDLQGKREELERAYKTRIEGDATVILPINVEGLPMFFVTTPEIMGLEAQIYRSSLELRTLSAGLPEIAIDQYTRSILIEEIGLTHEIENIHSTRREIEDSLDAIVQNASAKSKMRFAGMIEKYNRLRHNDFVGLRTCEDIRTLYDEIVLPEILREDPKDSPDGEIFRKGPVIIQNRHGEKIHEGVFPETQIIKHMEVALTILADGSIPMLIRIAVFHYLFGYIHPFYNGNGRMTRFISSYMISQELSCEVALRLSAVIKENRARYYRAFKETNEKRNRGDLTGFIYDFLLFVKESIDNCLKFIRDKSGLLARFKQVLDVHERVPRKHPVLWVLLLNALFSDSGLSVQQLMEITDNGRTVTENELKTYVLEWGVVWTQKEGRKKIYRLDIDKLLDFLECE